MLNGDTSMPAKHSADDSSLVRTNLCHCLYIQSMDSMVEMGSEHTLGRLIGEGERERERERCV